MPVPSEIVVVGGGLAAVRLVQALRGAGSNARIRMIGAETGLPYDRPPLSKDVLRAGSEAPQLLTQQEFEQLDIDYRPGVAATALEAAGHRLRTSDGVVDGFDALVIATGASPRTISALAGPGTHVLRTSGDARRLREAMLRTGQVTIVGGGFIGCEVASSARTLEVDVVLVEALELPLVRALGRVGAHVVVERMRGAGVDVRSGTSVTGVTVSGATRVLTLTDGTVVPGDVVLVAVGVEPTSSWLVGSGLELENGIVCDAGGRTSLPGVWALGDVARWWLPSLSAHRRIEHWTNATEQAVTVAANLLSPGGAPGGALVHDPVPYVWSDQFDLTWQLVGLPDPLDETTVLYVGRAGDRPLIVYSRDGLLTGALGGGAPRQIMRLRGLLDLRGGGPAVGVEAALDVVA